MLPVFSKSPAWPTGPTSRLFLGRGTLVPGVRGGGRGGGSGGRASRREQRIPVVSILRLLLLLAGAGALRGRGGGSPAGSGAPRGGGHGQGAKVKAALDTVGVVRVCGFALGGLAGRRAAVEHGVEVVQPGARDVGKVVIGRAFLGIL